MSEILTESSLLVILVGFPALYVGWHILWGAVMGAYMGIRPVLQLLKLVPEYKMFNIQFTTNDKVGIIAAIEEVDRQEATAIAESSEGKRWIPPSTYPIPNPHWWPNF